MSKIDDAFSEYGLVPGLTNKLLKQALYKDMVELIGEDEPIELKESVEAIEMKLYANTTRQELRTKLKKYYGVEE